MSSNFDVSEKARAGSARLASAEVRSVRKPEVAEPMTEGKSDVAEITTARTEAVMGDADRFWRFKNLALQLVLDAALFVLWIVLAVGMHHLSRLAKQIGLNEYFAECFKWASSLALLCLALMYIIGDVVAEARRQWRSMRTAR